MKAILPFLLASLAFLGGADSCTPQGLHALVTEESALFDPALTGKFDVLGDDGKVDSTLLSQRDDSGGGPALAVTVTHTSRDKGRNKTEKFRYRVMLTEIGGARFIDSVAHSSDADYAKESSVPLHQVLRVESTPEGVKLFGLADGSAGEPLPTVTFHTAGGHESASTLDTAALRAWVEKSHKAGAFSRQLLNLRRRK